MPVYVIDCDRCGEWLRDASSPSREYCDSCQAYYQDQARQQEWETKEAERELERIRKRHTPKW